MHRMLLSAMLLLPAAGLAQAQTVDCATVLRISNWASEDTGRRGYFSNRVDLQNVSTYRIAVDHRYNGIGAIISQPAQLAPNGFVRREVSRTSNRQSWMAVQAATTLTCTRL